MKIENLPISERPYEKCEKFGTNILSDAELLAIIIRTGTNNKTSVELAQEILGLHNVHKGLLSLNYLSLNELTKIKGIGKIKAIQLQCIAEISRRFSKEIVKKQSDICFNSPEIIANYYMEDLTYLTREKMILVMFDTKGRIIKDMTISMGTVNASIISPREILIEALKFEAVSIVILHNHPSGDTTPSMQDILLTKKLKDASNIIGIQLKDHIIIGNKRYLSLVEQNYI